MNNVTKSPNENIPMDGKGGPEDGIPNRTKNPLKVRDPRHFHPDYANRPQVQRQQIIENSVVAPQIRDPNLMDISDDESAIGSNDDASSSSSTSRVQQRPRSLPVSSRATGTSSAGTSSGRNIARRTRLNHQPRDSGRTTYPSLNMDDLIFAIRINPVSTTGNSAAVSTNGNSVAAANVIPPPSPAQASPNVISTSTAEFFSTSGFFPPPPAPPLIPQSSPRPSSANQPPSGVPPPLLSSSRSHATAMPPPTASGSSRASLDVSPSPNHPPFASPPEDSGSNDLSNPMYFGNLLRIHSNTALEAARSHSENNVFGRLYMDYKKTTPNNDNEKNIRDNVVKGLKYLISDNIALVDENKMREEENANLRNELDALAVKLQKSESTTDGLKKLLENAEKKATKAAEEQKVANDECKMLKGKIAANGVHSELQKQSLDKYKDKNDKLFSENCGLKKSVDELKSSHARAIQALEDKLKTEQEAKAALKNELKEAEENAEKESTEARKYRAQKKATDTENTRIKQELAEMKKEIQEKDNQISSMERDQKILTTSNRELTEQKNEAEEKVKQLEEQKKKENREAQGKAEGKTEAEATMNLDKRNQQSEALKLLVLDLNSIKNFSRKRKIRQLPPAAVNHTVSDAGPSTAKKRRVETDASPTNARPRSIPPTAIIRSEPIPTTQPQPLRTNSSGPSGVANAGDGNLFANDQINNLMQQIGAPPPSLPNMSIPPPPITVPPPSLPNMNIPPPPITVPPRSLLNMSIPPPPFVNRPPNNNSMQVSNPGYRPPTYAFMNQQNEPRMMQQQMPPQQFVPQNHHIPVQQQPMVHHDPNELLKLEQDVTPILQKTYQATPDNAHTFFYKLDRMSQDILKKYASYLMRTTDPHPIVQMLLNEKLNQQQQYAQQFHIQQQQQQARPPMPQVQQHLPPPMPQVQQQPRPPMPQVQQPPQRPVYERVQTAHRSANPGSFSNRRKNKAVPAPSQTVPPQVLYTQPIQPQQQQQRFGVPPQQSLSAGFQPQPQRPQSHQASAQPSQPQRTSVAQNPERNRTPASTTVTASTSSTPQLNQALNSRSSNSTPRVASDLSIETLLEMCQQPGPRRQQVNGGNILRNFNVPFGDEVSYSDANILDQSFRASSRKFAK